MKKSTYESIKQITNILIKININAHIFANILIVIHKVIAYLFQR